MSLLRAAAAQQRRALAAATPRRLASTHATEAHHDAHDSHHHPEDTTVYPKETFANKVWLGWLLAGAAATAFYKLAPAQGEDNYVTRLIEHYSTVKDVWTERNLKHLLLSVGEQTDALVVMEATRPPVHRYRFPQAFEQHSAHRLPVGMNVDLNGLVVKTESNYS